MCNYQFMISHKVSETGEGDAISDLKPDQGYQELYVSCADPNLWH